MKSFIEAAVIAALIAAPLAAFAQSSQPLTRAEVRADLVQVEKAGYNPNDWIHYPDNIQAAEARVAAEKGAAQADATGYGSGSNGSSQAGQRASSAVSTYSAPVAIYGH
ncbi:MULTISPECIES: DUF4148 domain-containing protein [Paraburkholderia]|jgi:hypothetical protein|uniref:DUF4148 domain-containing protein n=1 Tax=Paraburkholderia phenazinium TaxID=60549 RepID=A0A1N6KXW3_9BURK|nr:DUF4148 domain-containing protein [Paraburkholderia phenazinium]SIO61369.1 protein of unknown function [Paraburkholderia phenazinium]